MEPEQVTDPLTAGIVIMREVYAFLWRLGIIEVEKDEC